MSFLFSGINIGLKAFLILSWTLQFCKVWNCRPDIFLSDFSGWGRMWGREARREYQCSRWYYWREWYFNYSSRLFIITIPALILYWRHDGGEPLAWDAYHASGTPEKYKCSFNRV